MKTALVHVEKPVRKLRKSLKNLPQNPSIEAVHNLRTDARRLEAIIAALALDRLKCSRPLLKIIKRVRKAAGAVRDMDVLAADALKLAGNPRDQSVLCLIQYLEAKRIKRANHLLTTVEKHQGDFTGCLKRFLREIEKRLKLLAPGQSTAADLPDSNAKILMNGILLWPPFSRENLHSFRLRVKELRYVLQLADQADAKLQKALDNAKDRIGDWHDWQQLEEIGKRTLDANSDLATVGKIESMVNRKFRQALIAAQRLKKQALQTGRV